MNIIEWIRQVKKIIESPVETISALIVGVIVGALLTWRIARVVLTTKSAKEEIQRLKERIVGLKSKLIDGESTLERYIHDYCALKKINDALTNRWESTDFELGQALEKNNVLEVELARNKMNNQRRDPEPENLSRQEVPYLPPTDAENQLELHLKLVTTQQEIEKNLHVLEEYLSSSANEDVKFAQQLLIRGKCFVLFRVGERVIAGPSRFVGYANNSRQKHLADFNKDIISGAESNRAIGTLLGEYQQSKELDELFKRFCEQSGVTVTDSEHRKFWLLERVEASRPNIYDPDGIVPPDKKLFEEPDLSPEDEELLDRLVEERVRRKQAGLDPYNF